MANPTPFKNEKELVCACGKSGKEIMEAHNHCTGCNEPNPFDLPQGVTHQAGTVEHPEIKIESSEEICICGCTHVTTNGLCPHCMKFKSL